jgi:hypothetical protein
MTELDHDGTIKLVPLHTPIPGPLLAPSLLSLHSHLETEARPPTRKQMEGATRLHRHAWAMQPNSPARQRLQPGQPLCEASKQLHSIRSGRAGRLGPPGASRPPAAHRRPPPQACCLLTSLGGQAIPSVVATATLRQPPGTVADKGQLEESCWPYLGAPELDRTCAGELGSLHKDRSSQMRPVGLTEPSYATERQPFQTCPAAGGGQVGLTLCCK